jgi:hypothetical protein
MEVKTIGASGQVSLGKKYAGRTVVVDEIEEGVWMVKTAQVIPDNERWLHTPEMKRTLEAALKWGKENPPRETDIDALERKLMRRKRKAS